MREATLIMRHGKTQRDRENGCAARNAANKAARTAWMRKEVDEFPRHTCNGKRNRLVRR
jgi:hypothetical protein